MLISIQQPEYFPWLGYFHKILQVDEVVFLDNVQFKKRYFENRNKIRTFQGWCWINTPILTKGKYKQNINEVLIDNSQNWNHTVKNTIWLNYKKTPYWKELGDDLLSLLSGNFNQLSQLNISIILMLLDKLNINVNWSLGSSLSTKYSGSELILEICKKLRANAYYSGKDGANYLNQKDFDNNNIRVIYQDFKHPVYNQFHGEFYPFMSVIDLFFNYGKKTVDIIMDSKKIKD